MNSIQITDNISLYNGEAEKVIPILEDDSIDLTITSPPYNVKLGDNKFNKNPYDLYNDNKDHKKYIKWLKDIFSRLYPKLKSGGRVCINIGDGKNGAIPTHVDIIHFMTRELKYIPMANIIWNKSQIGNRFSWGSYMSPSCPSFPKPFEYIMVFAKETTKLQTKGETDLVPKQFIEWAFSIWNFAPETKMKKIGHPAMYPVILPYRLIKMLSWTNATILDIFNGAGTTGVACEQLGRKYIGIEMSKKYCDITEKRIKDTRPLSEINMFPGEEKWI
ncbi:MAG: DNA-methyltransferase [Candidatus Asgardarchaeia archaeon]